jgi:hypothetical protein
MNAMHRNSDPACEHDDDRNGYHSGDSDQTGNTRLTADR